jgi:hypothetical protein
MEQVNKAAAEGGLIQAGVRAGRPGERSRISRRPR